MNSQTQAKTILSTWALEFHEYGDFDDGISIVQDGYAMDDDDNEDPQQPCYAIYVHRDSLSGNFPEHKTFNGVVVERPNEEVCFYVWINLANGEVQEIILPDTELDLNDFYSIIIEIQRKHEDQ